MKHVILVQPASLNRYISGKSGIRIDGRPAIISLGGVIWTSPIPTSQELRDFYNSIEERVKNDSGLRKD